MTVVPLTAVPLTAVPLTPLTEVPLMVVPLMVVPLTPLTAPSVEKLVMALTASPLAAASMVLPSSAQEGA